MPSFPSSLLTTSCWLALGTCLAAQSPSASPQFAQVEVAEVRNYAPDSNALVETQATVCYADPLWHFLFVVDNGHGIFVVGSRTRFRFGDRVRVRGRVQNGHGSPILGGSELQVERLGTRGLPDPLSITLDGWSNTLADQRSTNWVELDCVVEQAAILQDATRLWCRDRSGTLFPATICGSTSSKSAWSLIGSRVAIRGALGLLIGRRNQVHSALLLVQDSSLLRVIRAADRPPPPVRADVVGFANVQEGGTFSASGQVTHADDGLIVLDDGDGAHAFEVSSTFDTPYETYVRALGTVEKSVWRAEVIRPGTTRLTIWPKFLALHKLVDVDVGRRITVGGDVVTYQPDKRRLLIERDGTRALVKLNPTIETDSLDLNAAQSVRATGVVLPETEDGLHVIGVARAEDVQILSRDYLLSPEKLAWTAAALASIGLLVLLAIGLLRRQIRSRTSALSELAAQLRASYDSVDAGLVAIRDNGEIFAVNRAAVRMVGTDLEPGDQAARFFSSLQGIAVDAAPLLEMASGFRGKSLEAAACECEFRMRGAEYGVVRATITSIRQGDRYLGALWVLHDETKLRTLQAELLQAQKMEAVGTLAGGIAHDFNNLLTGVIGNLALLRFDPGATITEKMALIDAAETAAVSAGEIISQLLSFSRRNELELKVCDPTAIVEHVRPLLRHGFDASIDFEFLPNAELPNLMADPTQLQQVILNLCVNARDAMASGGTITIGAELDSLGEGAAVAIFVRDTGSGMSTEIREKIFEPFFTTKNPGQGTGLGLTTSFGIVRQHGGELRCESTPDCGSEFRIVLPITQLPAIDTPKTPVESMADLRGNETVMVIEDEWVVRAVTVNILETAGYHVLQAETGDAGLETLASTDTKIDLLLVDLTMPGISGHEVARIVREQHPDLPIVISSGYSKTAEATATPNRFLPKPFKVRELLETIRDALHKQRIATP